MLYGEFIQKAMDATIMQADNGLVYLDPLWRITLHNNNLFFDQVSDFNVSPEEVYETLKLEVERRNITDSKKPAVMDWLYELITTQVEPIMLEEETDYLKNLTEYLRANKEAQTIKDEDWKKFTEQ